jgi:DNA-binding NarL/FixJ family response regulator
MAATRPIRMLLVDEHDLVRMSLMLMFENVPYIEVVGQAVDGQMAIDMVAELQPDVVLMDLNMPGMDGFTATAIIHERYPQIKVIILSGTMLEADTQTAIEAGASAFLSKDATADEIEGVIRDIVQ